MMLTRVIYTFNDFEMIHIYKVIKKLSLTGNDLILINLLISFI